MYESLVGARKLSTRQNSGKDANAVGGIGPASAWGGTKIPAGTTVAEVIMVCSSRTDLMFSHVAADAVLHTMNAPRRAANAWTRRILGRFLLEKSKSD